MTGALSLLIFTTCWRSLALGRTHAACNRGLVQLDRTVKHRRDFSVPDALLRNGAGRGIAEGLLSGLPASDMGRASRIASWLRAGNGSMIGGSDAQRDVFRAGSDRGCACAPARRMSCARIADSSERLAGTRQQPLRRGAPGTPDASRERQRKGTLGLVAALAFSAPAH